VAAKITKSKKNSGPSQVFGKDGVFYTFPQGEGGPMQIKIDFGLAPRPASYYYADSLLVSLDAELRMALLLFGRRAPKSNTFADSIEVVMPARSLFGQFWTSSREVEGAVDKILEASGAPPKVRAISGSDPPAASLFANAIFVAVGDGESTFDFYHLSPREVHLAKTQKIDMQIQPTIRVIMSSVLTKHFFETVRPYAEHDFIAQGGLERSKLASNTH
jgi:hypothetical protein